MIELTLAEVATAVDGRVSPEAAALRVTGPVVIDSRDVTPGALFVAIRGERVDGHDFAATAVTQGAVGVISEREIEGVPSVVVETGVPGSAGVDQPTVVALAALAHHVRNALANTTVVALTGSSGKTSTKDLIAQVLSEFGPTVAATGSRNNEIGFPLTVLAATHDTRFLVLEMGAREVGHIAMLCRIARPDIALALNVGLAHVGIFGSPDAVAKAKSEIVAALEPTGIAILNADDSRTRGMAAVTSARVVYFGESAHADVWASGVTLDDRARASFALHHADRVASVQLQVFGEHQVSNALAAAATALVLDCDLDLVAAALSRATAQSPMRMDVTTTPDGVIVINDAYNANPSSMRAALKALVAMGKGKRTFAVLGEMRELGDLSVREHDEIGRLAVRLNVSQVIAVGDGARVLHLGAANEGSWDQESVWVPDAAAAVAYLGAHVAPGDVVLVKASRAIGLEAVCDALSRPGFTSRAGGSGETETRASGFGDATSPVSTDLGDGRDLEGEHA